MFDEVIFMATKSILKQVTIRNKKQCEMLVNALEHAVNKASMSVAVNKPLYANKDDIAKMVFARK